MEPDCTLDQWMTSAMAAMSFAADNWPEFVQCMEATLMPGGVPISAATMLHHAQHLARLCDPSRMPT